MKVTFQSIELSKAGRSSQHTDFSNCEVTFDRLSSSGSTALTCPFTVADGTYDELRISFSPTFQVLINDADHGVFTDPSSPTLVSSSPPDGGAQFVPYTINFPHPGFGIPLATPLTLNGSVSISLLGDLNQTIRQSAPYDFSGTVNTSAPPIDVEAVPGSTAHEEFYVGANQSGVIKIFYDGAGNAVTAETAAVCSGWNGLEFAYPFSPSQVATQSGTGVFGAFLGVDSNGVVSWEVPSQQGWSAGAATFEIRRVTSLGNSTNIACQIGSETPPSGGDTFAVSAPTIAPSSSVPVTRVAN